MVYFVVFGRHSRKHTSAGYRVYAEALPGQRKHRRFSDYKAAGAALGPLLAGLISPSGWNNVFYMLMFADACALLFLIRLIHRELSCPGSATGDQMLSKEH
ncbi:hypothetical protein MC885_020717 [Smutsia gigantea]|nr:hypothetical protein MC885_020717 [Smutsia gigantea]